MPPIRVLIIDDHVVVRRGIQTFLETYPAIHIVGEAGNAQGAVHQAQSLQPDVVLMDLMLPGQGGVEAIIEIKRYAPELKIVVLTAFEAEGQIKAAFQAGADGYLFKDVDGLTIVDAVQAAQHGGMPVHPRVARYLVEGAAKHNGTPGNGATSLTRRETEVLQLMARGLSNKTIAQSLTLSEGTVKVYVSNILRKTDAANRTQASMQALRTGLIPGA
jgi:NarL family two-component system response regulator LiaR